MRIFFVFCLCATAIFLQANGNSALATKLSVSDALCKNATEPTSYVLHKCSVTDPSRWQTMLTQPGITTWWKYSFIDEDCTHGMPVYCECATALHQINVNGGASQFIALAPGETQSWRGSFSQAFGPALVFAKHTAPDLGNMVVDYLCPTPISKK